MPHRLRLILWLYLRVSINYMDYGGDNERVIKVVIWMGPCFRRMNICQKRGQWGYILHSLRRSTYIMDCLILVRFIEPRTLNLVKSGTGRRVVSLLTRPIPDIKNCARRNAGCPHNQIADGPDNVPLMTLTTGAGSSDWQDAVFPLHGLPLETRANSCHPPSKYNSSSQSIAMSCQNK